MTYRPAHRRPRWHDRPRAWLAAALAWARGTLQEDPELTDDHGNQIGGDLPPVRNREMIIAGKCESCWAQNGGEGCDWASCGCDCHDDDIYEDWDEPDAEPRMIRTAKVSGVHLPLSGGFVSPWVNCAFTPDVPRRVDAPTATAPGYRQDVPRPGHGARRDAATPLSNGHETAGPGHLTMFDIVPVRSPWTPRPDDTIIQSGPRLCAGRIALLADAW